MFVIFVDCLDIVFVFVVFVLVLIILFFLILFCIILFVDMDLDFIFIEFVEEFEEELIEFIWFVFFNVVVEGVLFIEFVMLIFLF